MSRILIYLLLLAAVTQGLSATTVTLVTSPNPATHGQSVTLTATVTSGATGRVTFYDGTTVLGVGIISGTSSASLTTIALPSGLRTLRAYYWGNGANAGASSAPLGQVVTPGVSLGLRAPVNYTTGGYPNSVTVGDLNGDQNADLVVSNTGGNNISVLLGNGDGTFKAPVAINAGSPPTSTVVGDFNADGRADLAVVSYYGLSVNILLGNGDGTFQPAIIIPINTFQPQALAVGDFNGDGKADLALAGSIPLRVMLGNGDGTFQAPVTYTGFGYTTSSVVVGDFNRDGKADVALGSVGGIAVLLGNGDGTFGAPVSYPAGNSPYIVALGDFNGDGKLDLAASGTSLELLLGNGDGTFKAAVTPSLGQSPHSLVAADLDGDGALDIISTSTSNTALSTVLGNGDSTFRAASGYVLPTTGYAVAVGDFNGDGKLDVVTANYDSGSVSIFLGGALPDLTLALTHGNGFTHGQPGASYKLTVTNSGLAPSAGAISVTQTLPSGFTATSMGGNGWTCTLNILTCTRADSLGFGSSFPPVVLTVTVGNQIGSVVSTATVSGGSDGNTSNNSATDTVTVRPSTTVSLTSSPNPSTLGQAVALTATVGNGTGKVTFFDGSTMLGVASISGGQATLSTILLPSGSRSLTARFNGDANFGTALSPVRVHTVNAVAQGGVQAGSIFLTGNVTFLAAGDFNRDGKLDILSVGADGAVLLGNGDGTFQAPKSFLTGGVNTVAAVGDLNGDGKLDLALWTLGTTGGFPSPLFFVLLGNGDGTFQTPVSINPLPTTGFPAGSMIITDINRDGLADIVILGASDFTVYLGNGDGTLQSPLTVLATTVGAAALSDINKDGNLDIVFSSGTAVSVMLGNGDGTFQPPSAYAGVNSGSTLTTGDFNGDGNADVVVLNTTTANLLVGNGDGTLRSPAASTLTVAPGYAVVSGDFNGDGRLDFAYRANTANAAIVVFGKGDGTFQSGTSVATDGSGGGIVLGDFNGDGRPDFAVANSDRGTINVFLGSAGLGLSPTSTHMRPFTAGSTGSYQISVSNPFLAFAPTSGMVIVTAILPDGLSVNSISGAGWTCNGTSCTRQDSLPIGSSYPPITLKVNVSNSLQPSTLNTSVTVTNGAFTTAASDPTSILLPSGTTISLSANTVAVGRAVTLTATVTGGTSGKVTFFDGTLPLATATLSGGGLATFTTTLLSAGSHLLLATFAGDSTHSPSPSTPKALTVTAGASSGFGPATLYASGTSPITVVSGDFNGDGKLDLATADSDANSITVMLGNGDGTFGAGVHYAVGTTPFVIVVADFNGDGKQDLAVGNSNSLMLSILLGKGDGTFQSATSVAVSRSVSHLSTGDFDQDGKPDLLAGFSDGSLHVLYGNGDATFRTGDSLSSLAIAIASGDFNGDGKPDFALLAAGPAPVSVFLGNGDGTFQQAAGAGGGNGSGFIVAGDLNGDGFLDVVTTDYNGGVDVFLGRGDGTFHTYVYYAASRNPSVPALADVNGDGKLDIVVSDSLTNTFSVLLGNGDGTFQTQTLYTISPPVTINGFNGMAAGDFNGDGRTDIAMAVTRTNNIAVLLGTPATTTPNYTGYLDSTTCQAVAGWAADRNRLSQSIVVSIYDGTTLIATIPANLLRSDVGALIGDNGLHGFSYTLPSALTTGTHNIHVQYDTSGVELGASPKVLTCGSSNYAGYVDAAACTGITGWAVDRNRLNVPITVTLWDGTTQIASVTANGSRPDVGSLLGDNGLHGFSIPIPSAYANGVSHALQVRYETSSAQLPGSPVNLTCIGSITSGYTGYIDSASCSGIIGWAADRGRLNVPINVTLWDGGTQIASTLASASRGDVGAVLGDNGLHGFSIPIPPAYANGVSHTLQVRYETSATQLPASPVTINCGSGANYAGWVDSSSCTGISGWAADKSRLNQVISVDLVEGSTILATVLANASRSDVGGLLGDNGLHGYNLIPPASLKDGTVHSIQVRYSGTSTPVPNSPQTLQCSGGTSYTGYVDQMSCSVIAGWGADRNKLNTTIDVQVFDGSALLGSVTANVPRGDVGAVLGDNGVHGFVFGTPASVKDGKSHAITVRPVGSGTAFPGLQSLTCP